MSKDLLKLLDNLNQEDTVSFSKHSRVLLIDGLNLFFRNFAMLNYVNPDGIHIGGLSGFLRSLGSLIKLNQPTSVYIVFDGVGSSNNRKNLLPEYKSNRNNTRITNWEVFENLEEENDAKIDQLSRLIQYLKCLPVKITSIDKVEADDVLAYLANHITIKHKNSKATIVSSDKDFIQLVNDNITVYRPTEKEHYYPQTIINKIGVLPENFILYKTLLGDKSDVVKGVKGLGEKKLIKLFPEIKEKVISLEDILQISGEKYKENVIYSRIVMMESDLRKNFQVMDLQNPLIDQKEKHILEELIEKKAYDLNQEVFIKLYTQDGLGTSIRNPKYWLQENFKTLTGYNK